MPCTASPSPHPPKVVFSYILANESLVLVGSYAQYKSAFDELCDAADDELLNNTVRLSVSNHVFAHTLPPPPSTASQNYSLRHRTHSLQLPAHATHLTL